MSRRTAARVTPGCDLFEQLEPFCAEAVLEQGKSSDVATRPRQALDESRADRIDNTHEHNRRHRANLLERPHRSARGSNNDFRRERDKLRRVMAAAVSVERAPANVDPRVASECPSPLL